MGGIGLASIMNNERFFMKRWILPVLVMSITAPTIFAELPWNTMSLKIFVGPSQNGGTLKENGLEHEYEYGVGGVMALNDEIELELAASKWDVKSMTTATVLEEHANKLSLTGRRKYYFPSLFVPWWEAGLDFATIDSYERILQHTDAYNYYENEYSLSVFGGHVGIGVDIYPWEYSAIAVFFDIRYTYYFTNTDINQWSAYVGLRWDFWDRGLDRRNYKRVDLGDTHPLQETPVYLREASPDPKWQDFIPENLYKPIPKEGE